MSEPSYVKAGDAPAAAPRGKDAAPAPSVDVDVGGNQAFVMLLRTGGPLPLALALSVGNQELQARARAQRATTVVPPPRAAGAATANAKAAPLPPVTAIVAPATSAPPAAPATASAAPAASAKLATTPTADATAKPGAKSTTVQRTADATAKPAASAAAKPAGKAAPANAAAAKGAPSGKAAAASKSASATTAKAGATARAALNAPGPKPPTIAAPPAPGGHTDKPNPGARTSTATALLHGAMQGGARGAAVPAAAPSAGGGGGGGGSIPAVDAWKAKVHGESAAIPEPHVGGGGGKPSVAAGEKSGHAAAARRKHVPVEAARTRPPPAPPVDPAPPEDLAPAPTQHVVDAAKAKLSDQTLPALVPSKSGTLPSLDGGMVPLTRDEYRAAVDESLIVTASDDPETQKKVTARIHQLRDKLQTQGVPYVGGEVAPVTLHDDGPPPAPPVPPLTAPVVSDIAARLVAEPEAQAKQLLDEARTAAYPNGILSEQYPDIGGELLPGLTTTVSATASDVARQAGVTQEELDTSVAQRKAALQAQRDAAAAAQAGDHNDAKAAVVAAAQEDKAAVAGAQKGIAADVEQKQQALAAEPPPAGPTERRDRYIQWVARTVAEGATQIKQASERRVTELNQNEKKQTDAYRVLGQKEELAIRNADTPQPPKTQPPKAPSPEALAKAAEVSAWAREQVDTAHTSFESLRRAAAQESDGHSGDLLHAGMAARQSARAWCDEQTNDYRNVFEKYHEMNEDMLAQTKANADRWALEENRRTAVGLEKDLGGLVALDREVREGVTREALLADDRLTDERRRIIEVYFKGGVAHDLVSLAAESLRLRIADTERPQLLKAFEDTLCAITDVGQWKKLDNISAAQGRSMAGPAQKIHAALDHWFHATMDPPTVFAMLDGVTRVQAATLRLIYRKEFDMSLEDDIKKSLDGPLGNSDEVKRADAELAGDKGRADAAALEAAIHWYGNDTDSMMAALRQKSPEERDRMIEAYDRLYPSADGQAGGLRRRLEKQLSGLNKERADALLAIDNDKADAIGLRIALPATHEYDPATAGEDGPPPPMGNKKRIESIYNNIRDEVTQLGDREGWTSAQIETEINRRTRSVEGKFDAQFAKDYQRPPGEAGAMRVAIERNFVGGPTKDLVNALANNDLVGADAARIEVEHQGLWATDSVLNNVVEQQYLRALDNERRDHGPELRKKLEENFRKQVDESKQPGHTPLTYDQQRQLRIELEDDLDDQLSERAKPEAQLNLGALRGTYKGNYKNDLDEVIKSDTSGTDNLKAKRMLQTGGYLSLAEHVYFSTKGLGTNDTELDAALNGKSKAKLDQARREYAQDHPGRSLDADVLDDSEGREIHDRGQALKGKPETARDEVERLREDVAYEHSGHWNVASRERAWLDEQLKEAEAQAAIIYDPHASDEAKERAGRQFDLDTEYVKTAVEDHRRAVDSITDTITMVAALVVAAAVTALTAGAAGPVMAAVLGLIYATATTVVLKSVIKGQAYGTAELGTDLAVGAVDAAMAGLTAGLGGKLLGQAARPIEGLTVEATERLSRGAISRALPTVEWMAKAVESNSAFKKNMAIVLAHGAEALVQGTPSAFVTNLLNDQNWESGDPLSNILRGTIEQSASNLKFAFAMQLGHWAGGKLAGGVKWGLNKTVGEAPHFTAGEPHERPVEFKQAQERDPKLKYAEWLVGEDNQALERRARAAGGASEPLRPEQPTALHELPEHERAARQKEMAKGLADDKMRQRVKVVIDPELAGKSVEVRWANERLGSGEVVVRCGPDALPSDVALHLDTVKAVEAYGGLRGKARALLGYLRSLDGETPRPLSKEWAAQMEVVKLTTAIDVRLEMLAAAGMPPSALEVVTRDIESLGEQLQEKKMLAEVRDTRRADVIAAYDRDAERKALEKFESLEGKPIPAGHYFTKEPQLKRLPKFSERTPLMTVVEVKNPPKGGDRFVYAEKVNAAAIADGYPQPPEGYRWVRDRQGGHDLRPTAEMAASMKEGESPLHFDKKFLTDPTVNPWVEREGTRLDWPEAKANSAKGSLEPPKDGGFGALEDELKAREGAGWAKEDAGLIRRWDDAMKMTAEKGGFGAEAMVKELLGEMGPGYNRGAYDKFRRSLREKMLETVAKQPAEMRMKVLRELMATLPDQGGSVGALFSEFRRQTLAGGRRLESIDLDRKSVHDPEGAIEKSRKPGETKGRLKRDVDGAVEYKKPIDENGAPPEDALGTYAVDDKAGANPFDLQQAKDYSALLNGKDGLRTVGRDKAYAGLVYFFENRDAAERAMKLIEKNGLSSKIYVAYFNDAAQVEWVPRGG